MKNLLKLCLALVVISLTLLPTQIRAQVDNTQFSIERHLNFDDTSEIKTIPIEVIESTEFLHIEVTCIVEFGSLTMEIYNPNNTKQGQFSVEGQVKKNVSGNIEEMVSGNLVKNLENPTQGTWIIKLIPKNVTGTMNVKYSRAK